MKNKNRITLLNFLSNLLLRGISIFSAPVFSRLLGTSGFGIVSVYNIWTRILGVAVPMQSNLTLVNARVEYPEDQQDAYQSSVLTMSLLMFAAATALGTIFLKPISQFLNLPAILIYLMLLQAFGNFATSFAVFFPINGIPRAQINLAIVILRLS